jgi:tetratricopeptide (TPR) repeat protein
MAKPQQRKSDAQREKARQDALERLYVYWLFSTALLLALGAVLGVFVGTALQGHKARAERLEQRVRILEDAVATLQASPPPVVEPAATVPPPVREVVPPAAPAPAVAPPPAGLAEHEVRARFRQVVGMPAATPKDIVDLGGARALVEAGLREIGRASWSGETWSQLAILATLLGQEGAAETFARRVPADGTSLGDYLAVSVRALLAQGRAREALPLIDQLSEQTLGSPTSQAFLAVASWMAGDYAAADAAAELLEAPAVLLPYDRLLVGRMLMERAQWRRLRELLATVQRDAAGLEADLSAAYNFLQATVRLRQGEPQTALALLEYLAAHPVDRTVDPETPAWPALGPDAYTIQVWRGVALMYAQQPSAAREALETAARLDPGRSDAYYYLGSLAFRARDYERAVSYAETALSCSAKMASAWELLALIALDRGDVDLALGHAAKATDIDPRRASAQFLTALAHAKLEQRDAAAAALGAAFELDASYLEEALRTEVLLRLFAREELEAIAGALPDAEAPAEADETP